MRHFSFFFNSFKVQIEQRKASKVPKNRFSKVETGAPEKKKTEKRKP